MGDLKVGIVTCSDSCAAGTREDTAGRSLAALVRERGWTPLGPSVCADERDAIAEHIVRLADEEDADVVLTTGGTGLSPRDVAPEATMSVADRAVPGVAEAIRVLSLEVTRRAMLSRGTAAQRGSTLIINVPGSEKAARETFGFVADQLEHAVEMMAGGGHD